MAAGCSSTPATASAPRSPRPAPPSTRRSSAQRQLGLPVRMGVATGEAQERDGDYFGPALNRAARVMAAGHGGQILLAGVDRGAGRPASSSSTSASTACGTCRASSTSSRSAPTGWPSTFPPLRTLDAVPGQPAGAGHQLRRPRRRGEGADRAGAGAPAGDAHRRRRRRQDPPRRPGRRRAGGEFPDGVWLVELAPSATPPPSPTRSPPRWGSPRRPDDGDRRHRRRRCRAGACCSCSTTASTCSTPPLTWSRRS